MKKRNVFFLGMLAVLLVMGLVLAGCGGDGDVTSPGGNENNSDNQNNKDNQTTGTMFNVFEGTWKSSDGFVLVFSRSFEKTFTITSPGGIVENGTYTYNNDGKTATLNNETTGDKINVSISDTSLYYGAKEYVFQF